MESLVIQARAKVNLSLRVVGRRADGYHLLDGIVAFADVGDTLALRAAESLRLEIEGPMADAIPAGGDNIILKAAQTLGQYLHRPPQVAFHLIKRLPVAGGIGGGSADAAAALHGMCRLWGVDVPLEDLSRLALSLGADVPACLVGEDRRMRGVGEILEGVPPLPAATLLLINPRIPVSTPAVFGARTGGFSPPLEAMPEGWGTVEALAECLREQGNDLTEAAISVAPVIAEVLGRLEAVPGCLLARMSGSGGTCFGMFARREDAEAGVGEMQRLGWWAVAAAIGGKGPSSPRAGFGAAAPYPA